MTIETALIIVGIIAGILAALAVRLLYDNHDWAKFAKELQSENETLREDTQLLCKEKLSLTASVDDLQTENEHLKNQLDDALTAYENSEKERLRAITAATTQPPVEDEPIEIEPEVNPKERLPEGHTNIISGMPYTSITNHYSQQWALQCDENTFTNIYGIRSYNGGPGEPVYFLAAMGSAYGRTIGDTFKVTFRCGTEIYVMLAEYKDDGTDPNFFGHKTKNYIGDDVICILEFIYAPENIDKRVKGDNGSGTFTVFDEFGGLWGYGGDIVKIEYHGRKWTP